MKNFSYVKKEFPEVILIDDPQGIILDVKNSKIINYLDENVPVFSFSDTKDYIYGIRDVLVVVMSYAYQLYPKWLDKNKVLFQKNKVEFVPFERKYRQGLLF